MRTGASVYLRADGRWEARYQKGRTEDGKIIYGFVYGATKEEAERRRADAILETNPDAIQSKSLLPSLNPKLSGIEAKQYVKSIRVREKILPPYEEDEAEYLNECFLHSKDSYAIGFYLCLHMGFSLNEIELMRFEDIDLVNQVVRSPQSSLSSEDPNKLNCREVVIPNHVLTFLNERGVSQKNPKHFVLNDSVDAVCGVTKTGYALRRIIKENLQNGGHHVNRLRSTFIRRCLESNLNIETVSLLCGMEKTLLYRYFGNYIKADPMGITKLSINAAVSRLSETKKQLNLLILGAGSHGHSVKETAERLAVFQDIKFLDDSISSPDVIGKCSDYKMFIDKYPAMFPAFGDNELRNKWIKELRASGVILPRLIHPDTTISQRVTISDATIVLSQVTINAGVTIGEGVIVAANSMIGYDSKVGDFSHLDSGVILQKNANVPPMTTVESGEIVRNVTD